MSARVEWKGLAELKLKLHELPKDLTYDARAIVHHAALSAKGDIEAAYATGPTGNLKRGVKLIVKDTNQFGVNIVVKSTAEHAHWFETGTQARHYVTKNGVTHVTGSMPPNPVVVPAAIRHRRQMHRELKDMVVSHGLTVTDDGA